VLHDIDLSVKGGSIVAICGPTGAGKSTLVNLVARFYDPQNGRITIDGMDVRDATLSSLRTQVAFVFQETYLFSDTVAANIAYGRPGITMGEIEAAARLAQAHEFIDTLPKQYESVLAERGSSLSGGQKQRLAIARAVVLRPEIYLFDDSFSALDLATDARLRAALRPVTRDATVLLVAQRVSTIRDADLILVLEDGRVVGRGTHPELLDECPTYQEIVASQLSAEEAAA